jgi:hypothetical protein
MTHCAPWQIVTAMAFGGSTTFNPLTDTLQGMLEMMGIGQSVVALIPIAGPRPLPVRL